MRAAGDDVGPGKNTIEYFIDRGLGIESSGLLPFDNNEGGPLNYSVSMYTQTAPNLTNVGEFATTTFADIRYSPVAIPEPSTMALGLSALIGVLAIRRR
jgi:hypothetical protein